LNQSRQSNLVNVSKIRDTHVELYGIGSIGSWFALYLAKIGVNSISVWDFDTVEEVNCSAQAYGINQIGQLKTEALYNIIKDQTGVKIEIHNEEIKENTELEPELNSFQYCGVDTLPVRKLIFNKLKGTSNYWIDSRIGGFEHSYYFLKLNGADVSRYEKTLTRISGKNYELKCGEKASIGNNIMLVSEIIANYVRIINDKPYLYHYVSNFLGNRPFIKAVR